MTDLAEFLSALQHDVEADGRAGEETYGRFVSLPQEVQATVFRAVRVLGCDVPEVDGAPVEIGEDARRKLLGLLLKRLAADTDDPRWSSQILDDTVQAALVVPGTVIGDLFAELARLWVEAGVSLTTPVANLTKELAMLCFTRRYRESYQRSDLSWLADLVKSTEQPAVSYLAVRTLPVDLAAQVKANILRALKTSDFVDEASALLDDSDD